MLQLMILRLKLGSSICNLTYSLGRDLDINFNLVRRNEILALYRKSKGLRVMQIHQKFNVL